MKNITQKIFLFLGILSLAFSLFLFYQTYAATRCRVREAVAHQAEMALQFNLAIREYVGRYIRPVMYDLAGTDHFTPETMSTSFVSRSIFEAVRGQFPRYIIKFSSDNPRNPLNQAGPEELEIIRFFNQNPAAERWRGKITIDGRQYLATFSVRRMEASCRLCHGDPKDAPPALIERYGSQAGFYRPLGEVIGLDTIAIPFADMRPSFYESLEAFVVSGIGLVLFFGSIALVVKFVVTQPIAHITRRIVQAAQQSDYTDFVPLEVKSRDEIGGLAAGFNTLVAKVASSYADFDRKLQERTADLQKANRELVRQAAVLREAQQTSLESEAKLSQIVHGCSVALFVLDRYHRVSHWNRACEKLTGFSQEQMVGSNSQWQAFYSGSGRCWRI